MKSGAGSTPPAPTYGVSITPSDFGSRSSNGSYTTPFMTANVSGGTPPYTYLWEATDGTVLSPTDAQTKITVSGYNEIIVGNLTVTVTDSLLAEVSDVTTYRVLFGDLV